jgi:hypothetical protein
LNALIKEARAITPARGIAGRVKALDWERASKDLDAQGCKCDALAELYPVDGLFRSRVVMGLHGFGRGEYKYFSYPLPNIVAGLRTAIYPRLAPIANRWNAAMGIDVRYPEKHSVYIGRCHAAGQLKPPLLLQYAADDYNCLHQDLYGEHVFPLQVTICCPSPNAASRVGNSCSPNSGRACSRGRKSCRSGRATRLSSPSNTVRCRARAVCIGSPCDTA